MKWYIVSIIPSIFFLAACSKSDFPEEEPPLYQGSAVFELTFGERMAIRAELTRLTAEAQREANELYSAFKSRELAVLNLETKLEFELQKHRALMDQYRLTSDDIDFIIQEYLTSQGVQIRN